MTHCARLVTHMNKREAKRAVCAVVARLIDSYTGVGQPYIDCDEGVKGWKPEDADVLADALETLREELDRRSGVAAHD